MPSLTLKCTQCETETKIDAATYGYATTKHKTLQDAIKGQGFEILHFDGGEGYFCFECKKAKLEGE